MARGLPTRIKVWIISYRSNTRNGHPDSNRQITKGAEAFKLIIEKSITQGAGENEVILDYALSEAKDRFGSFTSDRSKVI